MGLYILLFCTTFFSCIGLVPILFFNFLNFGPTHTHTDSLKGNPELSCLFLNHSARTCHLFLNMSHFSKKSLSVALFFWKRSRSSLLCLSRQSTRHKDVWTGGRLLFVHEAALTRSLIRPPPPTYTHTHTLASTAASHADVHMHQVQRESETGSQLSQDLCSSAAAANHLRGKSHLFLIRGQSDQTLKPVGQQQKQ